MYKTLEQHPRLTYRGVEMKLMRRVEKRRILFFFVIQIMIEVQINKAVVKTLIRYLLLIYFTGSMSEY